MSRLILGTIVSLTLLVSSPAFAADDHAAATHAGAARDASTVASDTHPRLPQQTTWVPRLVGAVAAMFLLAIPLGMVRWMFKREEPVIADHDEHSHSHEAHEHTSAGLDKHGAHDPHAGQGGHH